MHVVLLTTGRGSELSIQHVYHQTSSAQAQSRFVDLLVLDARMMSQSCLDSATRTVIEIRERDGLRHGVLLCEQPALPLIVASIRCGLRDIISQYISASHLRRMLRAALPSLSRREFRDAISFLRVFTAFTAGGAESIPLARRAEELDRRAEDLDEQFKLLNLEKDRLARLDQELRERTRRLDRQIARMQNDADIMSGPAGSGLSSADLDAMSQRLERRAQELDVREKLLNEMQALLLSTPQAAEMAKPLAQVTRSNYPHSQD